MVAAAMAGNESARDRVRREAHSPLRGRLERGDPALFARRQGAGPAGRRTTVWESLAILEYLAERYPRLWPRDAAERATARSLAAEMHAGFAELRQHMSMNVRKRYPGKGRTPEVLADIARVTAIWAQAKGPFLFGEFGAVDAMYAPVVLRFRTYGVEGPNRSYMDAMLALPAMREWIEAAEREPESIPSLDMYG